MWGWCVQCANERGTDPSFVGKCDIDELVARPCYGCMEAVYIDHAGRCVDGGCPLHAEVKEGEDG